MRIRIVFTLFLILLKSVNSFSLTYYVSASTGNDTRTTVQAQSTATPWKTIQKACNNATAGCFIYVMAGTYQEQVTMPVSGSAVGGYITIQNYNTDVVLLDGNAAVKTLFTISSKSYIRIQGINFTNCVGNNSIGLLINGTSNNIDILNNKFYGIVWTALAGQIPASTQNVQPLIVYGTNGATSITNLLIQGNELYNNRTGWSEVLAVNGYVDGFSILNNLVHDNEGLGIDCIGHEGTCPTAANDQARNGLVQGNTVYNCHELYDHYAPGIYVDGGKNITVERNICYRNDLGIEIGCENAGTTASGIIVRDNFMYRNLQAGMQVGGYDGPVNTGTVQSTVISNNTLFANDTLNVGNGEIILSYCATTSFTNNIIYAANKQILSDGWGGGTCTGYSFNYNMYYTLSGTTATLLFVLPGSSYTGLANFKTGFGQDANSSFQNPLLVSNVTANPNLHLTSTSPAKDAGNPSFVAGTGELDIDGETRIDNSRVEIGADEYPQTLGFSDNNVVVHYDKDDKIISGWIIYPNPAINRFKIEGHNGNEKIQKVYLFTPEMRYYELSPINASEYILPESFGQGMYKVIIETDNERIVKKLIKF